MTIATQTRSVTFLGNGATNSWNFSFVAVTASDITVTYTDASNNQTVLSPSQYTLVINAPATGAIWGIGGTVTYPTVGSPIAAGTSITISRTLPLTQTTSISNQGDYAPLVIEAALDVLEMQIQQVSGRTTQFRGIWQTATDYTSGDIVQDGINGLDTNNYYICDNTHTSNVWVTDLAAGDWSLSVLATVPSGNYLPIAGGTITGNLTVNGTTTIGYTAPGTGAVATTVTGELHKGFLHLLDFGAVGNGSHDDTAAIQAWITACGSTGLTGWFDPAPGGSYLITSEISYTGPGGQSLSIMGPGYFHGAAVVMNSLSQNGFHFNTQGILNLSGFGVRSSGTATAGAAFLFSGTANYTTNAVIRNLTVQTSWNGFVSTGLGAYSSVSGCSFAGNNISVSLTSPSDFAFYDNFVTGLVTGTGSNGLIVLGDPGGLRVENNKFNHPISFGVPIVATASISDGDFIVTGNSIESFTAYGILINQASSAGFGNIIIQGNEFAGSGAYGIVINSSIPLFSNIIISGNAITTTTNQSIVVDAGTNISIVNNYASTGIVIGTACTHGIVEGNIIGGGATIGNTSASVSVVNNPGYNPVGASAQTPTASPWTYTASSSPETLYISASTSITALTCNGTSILPHATAADAPFTLQLGPFEVAVITYGGTLTAKKMIH